MKKVLLILVAAVGLSATSCGSSASIKTEQDSLAYALGVDIGTTMWNQIDSTMSPDLVAQGILDVFAKKANMTTEQAGQYIQYYMTEVKPRIEGEKNEKAAVAFFEAAEKEAGAVKSESGLISVVTAPGDEPKAVAGDTVTVNYTLYDASGKKLQSSIEAGYPLTFPLEDGQMIEGFIEGVTGLGQGGSATLYLPSALAYGDQGRGSIGPKSALKFDVEVVKVVKPTAAPEAKK